MCDGHDHHTQERIIQTTESVFSQNDTVAHALRHTFADKGMLVLNIVSSPGSGKTTLLEKTAAHLASTLHMGVIEGDQQTSNDADRIKKTGIAAQQINTINGCHLDATQIRRTLPSFDMDELELLFIENVGNLICPADYDLGEDFRVLVLSVTEGEDKPIKYPTMFMSADVILINKTDLVDVLEFDMEACRKYIRRINAQALLLEVSARSGEGMDAWYQWLIKQTRDKKDGKIGHSH